MKNVIHTTVSLTLFPFFLTEIMSKKRVADNFHRTELSHMEFSRSQFVLWHVRCSQGSHNKLAAVRWPQRVGHGKLSHSATTDLQFVLSSWTFWWQIEESCWLHVHRGWLLLVRTDSGKLVVTIVHSLSNWQIPPLAVTIYLSYDNVLCIGLNTFWGTFEGPKYYIHIIEGLSSTHFKTSSISNFNRF